MIVAAGSWQRQRQWSDGEGDGDGDGDDDSNAEQHEVGGEKRAAGLFGGSFWGFGVAVSFGVLFQGRCQHSAVTYTECRVLVRGKEVSLYLCLAGGIQRGQPGAWGKNGTRGHGSEANTKQNYRRAQDWILPLGQPGPSRRSAVRF